MLPGSLTALISLHRGRICPAHSFLFTIRESTGKILSFRRVHSEVRINLQLSYDRLQEFIDNPKTKPANWTRNDRDSILRLVRLTRRMRRNRERSDHPLAIETSETRVLCDNVSMSVTGLKKSTAREAEQLIEECMLAANSAAACELVKHEIPGIFRVHPEPQSGKTADFSRMMQTEFRIPVGDLKKRAGCEHFLRNLPDDPRKPVILSNFLKSLPRAVYADRPALHFGLGKYCYCHFTSPIRRYPDLLVHRQFWALDTGGKPVSADFLKEEAVRCSRLEERNDNAYFAASDRLKLHYLHMQQDSDAEIPAIYEAVIAKIIPSGLLCGIEDIGLFGFVPAEKLRGETRFSHKSHRFRASRGHVQYKCGDILYVVLDSLDFVRGRAIFRPV